MSIYIAIVAAFMPAAIGATPTLAESAPSSLIEAPEVEITATALRLRDEITTHTPQLVSIEQPSGQGDLSHSLKHLPGVSVRQTTGSGSLTTAFTSLALSSGQTQVSFEGLPVINPLGTGVNFSLFPHVFVESLENIGPFYANFDSTQDVRPMPGGRLNLKLRKPGAGDARNKLKAQVTMGAPAQTVQGAASYSGGTTGSGYLVGLSAFTTDGHYQYRDPQTHDIQRRGNNDATGFGVVAKKEFSVAGGTLSFLGLGSHQDHTVPGSLDFPSRDHEVDDLQMLGLQFQNRRVFAKASITHSRTGDRATDAQSTDDRTYGGFTQVGTTADWNDHITSTFSIDNEYDRFKSPQGLFQRNIVGMTAQLNYMPVLSLPLTIAPLIRQELASVYSGARDYRLAFLYSLDPTWDVSFAVGLDHLYPAITAASGYQAGGFTVRPNQDLGVERYRTIMLSTTKRFKNLNLYAQMFQSEVRNRSTFQFLPDGTARYAGTALAHMRGATLDVQWFPLWWLSARGGATVQRAWDGATSQDLPFKPRTQWLAGFGVKPISTVLVGVDETYGGSRLFGAEPAARLSPLITTNLRMDVQIAKQSLVFLRVDNLWDREGLDYPGFPQSGRSFWLGYSYGERAL